MADTEKDRTTKLILYRDTPYQCWARVDLANGDPIYISIARSGVIIKKSNFGVFGPDLYRSNIHGALLKAQAIDAETQSYSTPHDMTNPALRAFTQATLDASSAADLASRLNGTSNRLIAGKSTL